MELRSPELIQLVCAACKKPYNPLAVNTYATCCEQPLLTHYNFDHSLPGKSIIGNEDSMWRYFHLLPVLDRKNIVSLGKK